MPTRAPEWQAADWLNSTEPLTLAGLRGRVVVLLHNVAPEINGSSALWAKGSLGSSIGIWHLRSERSVSRYRNATYCDRNIKARRHTDVVWAG
jgi:hypothetical protein